MPLLGRAGVHHGRVYRQHRQLLKAPPIVEAHPMASHLALSSTAYSIPTPYSPPLAIRLIGVEGRPERNTGFSVANLALPPSSPLLSERDNVGLISENKGRPCWHQPVATML